MCCGGVQDSPSSKLLYAKDIPRYRQMVSAFYKSVQESAPVTDQQIADFMRQHSQVNKAFIIIIIIIGIGLSSH